MDAKGRSSIALRRTSPASRSWIAIAAVLATLTLLAGAPRARAEPCSLEGAARAQVVSVNQRLEVSLADGRTVKLVGIDPPNPTPDDPDLDSRTGAKLESWLNHREIMIRTLSERPDRWGRTLALAFVTEGSTTLSVGEALLDAGLARFAPDLGAKPCRAAWLAAEALARNQRLGLWADPFYRILLATDRGAFDDKAATNVLVEGEVAAVSEGPFRTILYFGPRRGYDLVVTVQPRNVKLFQASGLSLASLKGQKLRVRGLLDLRFGPQIEVSSPDEIEVVPSSRRILQSTVQP